MSLLVAIIIGGVIGWLASILMKTNSQMGVVANVVIGVVGSLLGNAIAGALGVRVHSAAGAWIVAVIGAALLIALLRMLGVFEKKRAWR